MVPSGEAKPEKKRARAKVLILLFLATTAFVLVRGRCILPEARLMSGQEAVRLSHVLRDSDSAVVARIVDIARPIRNHTCLLHTIAGDEPSHSPPTLYTAIDIEVEERLFFDPEFPALEPPEIPYGKLRIWMVGDPTEGAWAGSKKDEPAIFSTLPLHEGEHRLFFLKYANLHFIDRIGPLKWMSARGGFTWAPWSGDTWFPSMRSLQEDLAGDRFPRLRRTSVDEYTRAVPREDLRSVLQSLHGSEAPAA